MRKMVFLLIVVITILSVPVNAHSFSEANIKYGGFPFKFGQFIDGISEMIEKECGKCVRYYHVYPLNADKVGAYVAVLEIDNDGDELLSVSIACQNLTNVEGVLTIQFSFGIHNDLYLEGAYESATFSLLKAEKTENLAVDELFQKIKTFYDYNQERDERYNDYEVDFGGLYQSTRGENYGNTLIYENVIRLTRLISWFICHSYDYFTEEVYISSNKTELRRGVTKIAAHDEREILILNCPSYYCINVDADHCPSLFSINEGALQLVLEPIHEKKILRLSKIITTNREVDPMAEELKEDLRLFFKYLDRFRFSDYH